MSQLYYTPPSQEMFDEVQKQSIAIWRTYDNTYGYADEKVEKIKNIENVGDNFMYMIAMFDSANQTKLARSLSTEAKRAISDRLVDGGTPDYFNHFL